MKRQTKNLTRQKKEIYLRGEEVNGAEETKRGKKSFSTVNTRNNRIGIWQD